MGLRFAKMEELDEICAICESIKSIYKENGIRLWNEYYPLREDFLEDIEKNRLYVYCINDEIVGSFSVEDTLFDENEPVSPEVKYPCRFMVRPELQNRGIGTAIIHELYQLLSSMGVKEMRFLVSQNNPRAMQLYLREGCVNHGYIEVPWEDEGQKYFLFSRKIEV